MAGSRKLEVQIVGDTRGLQRAFGDASSSAGRFGASMARAGKVAAVGLGAGLAVVGLGLKSALSAAGEFESTLNSFRAVSGATADQMRDVSKAAKALGRDTGLPATSAKDAAEAMTELAKGGLSVAQAMKAARGVLTLSAAAQVGNAEAATITARALNAFKMRGNQAIRVADVLANAANASTGEITDMAAALQQSSAVAAQAGLSIEDTATAISLMANRGVVGSDAGTSLKTMLARLIPMTEGASKAMKQLGVDAFDQQGKMLPLREIIDQYATSLRRLSPEQRQVALQTIFGADAIRAANIILGEGVGAYDKMRMAIGQQGSASELAAAKMQGYKGSMEAFKSQVETLQIELGQKLLPVMTRLMTWANANFPAFERFATQAFDKIGSAIQALAGQWPRVKAAAEVVAAWYRSTLLPTIKSVIENLREFWDKFGADIVRVVRADLIVLKNAINTVLAVIRGDWNAAWRSLLPTVSGTLRAAAAMVTLQQRVFKAAAEALGRAVVDGVKAGMAALAAAVTERLRAAPEAIRRFIGAVYSAAIAIGRALTDGVIAGIGDIGGRIYGAAAGGLRGAISRLKSLAEIRSPSALMAREIGKPLGDGIVQGMDGGLALLYPKAQARLQAFTDKLEAQIKAARSRLGTAMGSLSEKLLRAFDAETSGYMTPAEAEIAAIEKARRDTGLQQALSDALASGDAAAIARAEEDIRLAALQEQAANERKAYEDQRASMRENLDKRLTMLGAHFQKEGTTVKLALAAISKLMGKYGITFEEAGDYIGKSFLFGLQKAIGGAAAAAGGVHGAQTGGNARPSPPIVTQVVLDGKIVAESVREQNAVYARANGAVVPV